MPDLYVTRALPNPPGKDRTPANRATNEQLNAEWVEFQNTTDRTLSLDGVSLTHMTFDNRCNPHHEDHLTAFTGSLQAGRSIRIHTGSGTGWWEGDIFHFYLGRENFVWNNVCGDRVQLRNQQGQSLDWAAYAPNSADGKVLLRVAGTNILQ